MAITITPEQGAAALEKAGSDLKALLNKEEVDIELQKKLYHIGITTRKRFAAFFKTEEKLIKVLKDNFEIDGDSDIMARVTVTKVMVAWEAAVAMSSRIAEVEAECEVKNVVKPIGGDDYRFMKDAFEKKWWHLEPKDVPGRYYLEKKID